ADRELIAFDLVDAEECLALGGPGIRGEVDGAFVGVDFECALRRDAVDAHGILEGILLDDEFGLHVVRTDLAWPAFPGSSGPRALEFRSIRLVFLLALLVFRASGDRETDRERQH